MLNIFTGGPKFNNLLAVDKLNWHDNLNLQEELTLNLYKVIVRVKFGRLNGPMQRMSLPMFFHRDMTLKEFIFAMVGELHNLQVSSVG